MIQFYPKYPRLFCSIARQSVLLPWPLGKLIEQKILSRHKHMDLVPEVILENMPAPSQGRAELAAHLLAGAMVVRMAEVMPLAQAYGPAMDLLVLADSPASLGNVLDRGEHIGMAHEQTRQATAMLGDRVHALLLILAGPGRAADHYAAPVLLLHRSKSSVRLTHGLRSRSLPTQPTLTNSALMSSAFMAPLLYVFVVPAR
jgi:hypothetical protein